MEKLNRRPWLWLLFGTLLVVASHFRFQIGWLAWVAPVPWLHYLRLRHQLGSRLLFLGVACAAWTLTTLKIITFPIPAALALAYGVSIGLVHGLSYVGADLLRRRLGENLGTLGFGALVVATQWSMHAALPLGTWGSFANTQVENLPLLQLASLTGLHGVSFLMALAASLVARRLAGQKREISRSAVALVGVLTMAMVGGQLRLSSASGTAQSSRSVAAVGTDSMVGVSQVLPDEARLAADEAGLFRRTRQAARGGADLVVWTEAATMVRAQDETALQGRLGSLAERLHIELVAAYVVLLSEEPLRYENKYSYFLADGTLHHSYLKHEPVPGEPAVAGTGPVPLVADRGKGSVSGAICYDYDFPYIGLAHARRGADLVVLPSSDWRGIDPIHTQMAALRAIEGGHSVLRSTRFGLSAGIDPYGRIRGQQSHFDGKDRVLMVDLPTQGVQTLYGLWGDWFVWLCLAFAGASALAAFRPRAAMVASPHAADGHLGGFAGRRPSV